MIKLSVNESKWSSLPARIRALILYISIWIFDFGLESTLGHTEVSHKLRFTNLRFLLQQTIQSHRRFMMCLFKYKNHQTQQVPFSLFQERLSRSSRFSGSTRFCMNWIDIQSVILYHYLENGWYISWYESPNKIILSMNWLRMVSLLL